MASNEAEQKTTVTTMENLRPPADSGNMPQVSMGFASLQSFELMQRAAKLLAASSLVPQQYQGNLANCVIALNMSQRIGADPLMVMQNLYVVHGRPAWSAQFTIACFNQCGRFSAMRYRWFSRPTKVGEIPDEWSCQAYATELSSGETIEGPVVSIAMAKKEGWYQKSGSKWQTIPDLMLMYRSGAWLVRTHAPEISMGLQTAEEVHDVYEARRGADGSYEVTLDNLRTGDAEQQAPGPAGMDPETGEVVETGNAQEASAETAQEPKQQDAIPQFDTASAIKALESKRTVKTLAEQFREIAIDFSNTERDLPDEVQAKYDELHEHLTAKESESAL